MAHVMVVDDEPGICWAFRSFLGDDGHRVTVSSSAEAAFERLAADPPDVLFLDVRLPGMDGLTAMSRIRQLSPSTPIIVMTAHGTVETAVDAVKGGVLDYLPKPFDLEQARRLVARALQGRPGATVPGSAPAAVGTLVGHSPAMQGIFKQIALAAACAEPVLITGASGTGKELVARAIHRHGDRAGEPFVPVHLAALPEGLVERELFGHERGAFTGADASRPGLLDEAGRGTVFFDEVAEAPLSFQAKLLRVLDGGEYRPVGGGAEKRLRARVIAATNRDLSAWVRDGRFRADLYYRLAVLPIHLPPLRERREDIPALWDHLLNRVVPLPREPLDPGSPVGRLLLAHDWPGNVRELRNAAEHAARAAGDGPIHPEHLPPTILDGPAGVPREAVLEEAVTDWARARLDPSGDDRTDLHRRFLAAAEPSLIRAVLSWAGGNQSRAARRLGLHRTTLRQKLREYGMDASKGD